MRESVCRIVLQGQLAGQPSSPSMLISVTETSVNPKRAALPPAFFEWIASPEGKSALRAAAEDVRSSVQRLNEERTIQPEQLHVPITL
jgi:hypothetical protein